VVGYQDFTATASVHKMIANPLNAIDNRVSAVLPGVPSGTTLLKWDDVTDQFVSNFYLSSWSDPNMTLAPGEGALFLTGTTTTKTFVGEVPQGYLTNRIPSGLSIRASKFPKTDVIGSLGFPIVTGDTIIKMTSTGSYTEHTYHNGIWTPSHPVINRGESFWIDKKTDWKQNISTWR
jgi:hypothetical protein